MADSRAFPGPVVLVHGVPDTHRVWDGVRAELRRDDILALDLPGGQEKLLDLDGLAQILLDQLGAVQQVPRCDLEFDHRHRPFSHEPKQIALPLAHGARLHVHDAHRAHGPA